MNKIPIDTTAVHFGRVDGVARREVFIKPEQSSQAIPFPRSNIRRIEPDGTTPVFTTGLVRNPVAGDAVVFLKEGGLFGFKNFFMKALTKRSQPVPEELPSGLALILELEGMGRERVHRFHQRHGHAHLSQSAPSSS